MRHLSKMVDSVNKFIGGSYMVEVERFMNSDEKDKDVVSDSGKEVAKNEENEKPVFKDRWAGFDITGKKCKST